MNMLDFDDEPLEDPEDEYFDESKWTRPSKPKRSRPGCVWNVLTALVLLMVICVASASVLIYLFPESGLNPFPPPTLPPVAVIPSATPSPTLQYTLTWTPTYTVEPTLTWTPRPTNTPYPTATFFSLITPSPTLTTTEVAHGYPFDVQQGSPVAVANIFHPELGCAWMGVGGQAVDMSGSPVTGLVIRLGGVLGGKFVPEMTSLTGIAIDYGRAGYEFKLADEPIASQDTLWVQLLDQAGIPLSDKIYFDTYAECEKNLIIINFKQVRP